MRRIGSGLSSGLFDCSSRRGGWKIYGLSPIIQYNINQYRSAMPNARRDQMSPEKQDVAGSKMESKDARLYTPPQVIELDKLARGLGAVCGPGGTNAEGCVSGDVAGQQLCSLGALVST
jgi:hypothetical protein